MSTDLTVILEHRPGELARLGEITGEAGVSIRGLAAFTGEGRGVVHVLLDDDALADCRAALEQAGIGIADEREVLVVAIEDRPMALGPGNSPTQTSTSILPTPRSAPRRS
jgi:hypothetical protein